jgi:hypothetical protein
MARDLAFAVIVYAKNLVVGLGQGEIEQAEAESHADHIGVLGVHEPGQIEEESDLVLADGGARGPLVLDDEPVSPGPTIAAQRDFLGELLVAVEGEKPLPFLLQIAVVGEDWMGRAAGLGH